MRKSRSLTALILLVLPLAAEAALAPVGSPFAVTDESPCSFLTELEVMATPKGAFEVVWVDDWEGAVLGRRFTRTLEPGGPPVPLLPLHGGLNFFDLLGIWTPGRYELAMNVLDFGTDPSDPAAAYRMSLDLNGNPLAPVVRMETPRFLEIAPAAGGDSLQLRVEPPIFGPTTCQSVGLLARRVDENGAPLSSASRVTRRASHWNLNHLVVDRMPDDTFFIAYSTCQHFVGLVVRRLNANGVPVGKPINLPMPGRVGNFGGGDLVLAARDASNLVLAAMISSPTPGANGLYTRAVSNGTVFGPTRIPTPPIVANIGGVVDLESSPDGGYLLLFQGVSGAPARQVLFAQELNERGVPQGPALQLTEEDELSRSGAIASLPDGRWIVVTRSQRGEAPACTERLIGTVLSSD